MSLLERTLLVLLGGGVMIVAQEVPSNQVPVWVVLSAGVAVLVGVLSEAVVKVRSRAARMARKRRAERMQEMERDLSGYYVGFGGGSDK